MRVTVHLPGLLRAAADGAAHVPLEVDDDTVLRGVLDAPTHRHPGLDRRIRDDRGELRRYVNVFVGEDECRALGDLDAPVHEGADVRLLPSVAGAESSHRNHGTRRSHLPGTVAAGLSRRNSCGRR